MSKKQTILLIEDDKVSADEYLEDASTYLAQYEVKYEKPRKNISDIVDLIKKYSAVAVVVDERLMQHSDAGYLGIDLLKYLRNSRRGLPVVILTEYDQDSVLRKVPREQLFRKFDLLKPAGKKYHFDILKDLINQSLNKNKTKPSKGNTSAATKISKVNVEEIARQHFLLDDAVEKVIWFKNNKRKEVQLIEVSRTALPTGSVEAFFISSSKEIPFSLLVADVSPKEWESIQKGKIPLPDGWDLKKVAVFDRDTVLDKE